MMFGVHLRWLCLRLELGAGDAAILTLTWAFESLQMTEKEVRSSARRESGFANIQQTGHPDH